MKMFGRRFANAPIDSFMDRNNKFKQKDNESSSLLQLRIMPKNSRTKIQKNNKKYFFKKYHLQAKNKFTLKQYSF